MSHQVSYDELMQKWARVLNEESAGAITDNHRKEVTAAFLENQEITLSEEGLRNERSNRTSLTSDATSTRNL